MLAVALLSACGGAQTKGASTLREWLIGGWVAEGFACDSDAGIVYNADGTYQNYDAGGVWSLSGHILTSRQTESWGEGGETKPDPGSPMSGEIQRLSADQMLAIYPDGSRNIINRCEYTPWGKVR